MAIKKAGKARDPKIYRVTTPAGTRLIRASSAQGAVGFAVDSTHKAEVASQADLVDLLTKGVKVEESTDAGKQLALD